MELPKIKQNVYQSNGDDWVCGSCHLLLCAILILCVADTRSCAFICHPLLAHLKNVLLPNNGHNRLWCGVCLIKEYVLGLDHFYPWDFVSVS